MFEQIILNNVIQFELVKNMFIMLIVHIQFFFLLCRYTNFNDDLRRQKC